MIQMNQEEGIQILGTEREVVTDLIVIVHSMYNAGIDKDVIKRAVRAGLYKDDELNQKIADKQEKVDELMKQIFGEDEE